MDPIDHIRGVFRAIFPDLTDITVQADDADCFVLISRNGELLHYSHPIGAGVTWYSFVEADGQTEPVCFPVLS